MILTMGPKLWSISLLFLLQAGTLLSSPNCPIYGAEFPRPQRLAESNPWRLAIQNLTATFDDIESNVAENTSYSIQVFSTNPGPRILFERYHTAANLSPYTPGVKKVDADTVYRYGSVTKLYAVLTFLVEAGDKYFNHAITEFIPELAALSAARAGQSDEEQLRSVDWDDVTILALASQMAGIERDRKSRASS